MRYRISLIFCIQDIPDFCGLAIRRPIGPILTKIRWCWGNSLSLFSSSKFDAISCLVFSLDRNSFAKQSKYFRLLILVSLFGTVLLLLYFFFLHIRQSKIGKKRQTFKAEKDNQSNRPECLPGYSGECKGKAQNYGPV